MKQQDFKQLLERFSNGESSKEEEEFVLAWYENVHDNDQFGQDEERLKSIEVKMWRNIKPVEFKQQLSRFSPAKVAAAVAILLLSMAGVFFGTSLFKSSGLLALSSPDDENEQSITITNSNQTPFTLKLDDGSEVTLQPSSEIRYPRTFGNQREVYLSGEAFFKVMRDTLHPFLVYSNEVVTRVLGTSFTVKAYKDEREITVSVKSGKVSVYTLAEKGKQTAESNELHGLILIPNQQAIYQRDGQYVEKTLVEKPEIILPKPTLFEMQYDGAPVVKIFEVLEENYGVDFVFDEKLLSECALTTSFTDEGLYERIEVICRAIGAEYEIDNAAIVIKSNGCK